MRRKTSPLEDSIEILTKLPWWCSVIAAIGVFVVTNILIPSSLQNNPFAKGINGMLSLVGQIFSLVCLLLALILYFKQGKFTPLLQKSSVKKSNKWEKIGASGKLFTMADPTPPAEQRSETIKRKANAIEKQYLMKETSYERKKKQVEVEENHPPTDDCTETKAVTIKSENEIWTNEIWTQELVHSIEWKLYEDLCKKLLRYRGYKAENTQIGADGGIDINIYDKQDETKIYAIAQCKSYATYKIGVKAIRELFGIMAAGKIDKGFFFTTSNFSRPAVEFAEGKNISLINGDEVLEYIRELKKKQQEELYT